MTVKPFSGQTGRLILLFYCLGKKASDLPSLIACQKAGYQNNHENDFCQSHRSLPKSRFPQADLRLGSSRLSSGAIIIIIFDIALL